MDQSDQDDDKKGKESPDDKNRKHASDCKTTITRPMRRFDVPQQIARCGPLDETTLESLETNREELQVFVDRLESTMVEETRYSKLIKMAAKDRLTLALQANIIDSFRGHPRFSDPVDLGDIPNEDKLSEGGVVVINRKEGHEKFTIPLYIRQHLIHQLANVRSFLNDEGKRKLYVAGDPGCGKTCFFWMVAGMLMNQNKRILFIQYRVEKYSLIWVLEDGKMRELISPIAEPQQMANIVRDLVKGQTKNFDLCICDGMITNDLLGRNLRQTLDWHLAFSTGHNEHTKISKLILVSSLQLSITLGQEMTGTTVAESLFDSWQWDDYEKAVMSDLVKNERIESVFMQDWTILASDSEKEGQRLVAGLHLNKYKLLELVQQKYHYAGDCARYMFDMNINELQRN